VKKNLEAKMINSRRQKKNLITTIDHITFYNSNIYHYILHFTFKHAYYFRPAELRMGGKNKSKSKTSKLPVHASSQSMDKVLPQHLPKAEVW
jgi:hypothetical protein